MAQTWPAKAPAEVVERRWSVPLDPYDSISTVSAIGTGVTVDETDSSLDEAVIIVSAGTADTTATVAVTVTSREGRTYTETFLLAIRATARQFTTTARDICSFALRKIAGIGEDAEAGEADDALERLNDMIADWRIDGADLGLTVPLALGDTVPIPDEFISALKFNLRIACHDHFDAPITAYDAGRADTTKRNITNKLTRFGDLGAPFGLTERTETVADLF